MCRFQFNRKNHDSVVVEGSRVDIVDGYITVVDAQDRPLATFDPAELSSWYRVMDPFRT